MAYALLLCAGLAGCGLGEILDHGDERDGGGGGATDAGLGDATPGPGLCGNGALDPGETCDPPSTCTATCEDADLCTADTLIGSAATCDLACVHAPILACASGDWCCPAGCAVEVDPDCGSACPPAQVIYVNLDGAEITDCACSDAPGNQSLVIGEVFNAASVTFPAYTGDRAYVVDHLVAAFAPYNVSVVTSRPAAGPYTMLIVTPFTGDHHGVAPQDCDNANPNDIAFVYNIGDHTADFVFRASAHELGHTFGLAHVVASNDFMQWASSGSSWTVSTLDMAHYWGQCTEEDVQDEPALLEANLGAACSPKRSTGAAQSEARPGAAGRPAGSRETALPTLAID